MLNKLKLLSRVKNLDCFDVESNDHMANAIVSFTNMKCHTHFRLLHCYRNRFSKANLRRLDCVK